MFLKTKIGFSCHLGKGLPDIKKAAPKGIPSVRLILLWFSNGGSISSPLLNIKIKMPGIGCLNRYRAFVRLFRAV